MILAKHTQALKTEAHQHADIHLDVTITLMRLMLVSAPISC